MREAVPEAREIHPLAHGSSRVGGSNGSPPPTPSTHNSENLSLRLGSLTTRQYSDTSFMLGCRRHELEMRFSP